ncbi:MAG TPA: hypothetical protein VK034_29370 [Enhygromyxa sp.]|nr:hypothetical protein [Enhygromyxa sp.]
MANLKDIVATLAILSAGTLTLTGCKKEGGETTNPDEVKAGDSAGEGEGAGEGEASCSGGEGEASCSGGEGDAPAEDGEAEGEASCSGAA